MARRGDLENFAKTHKLRIGTIADLIRYRLEKERNVERIAEKTITTEHGDFTMMCYDDHVNRSVHVALVKGEITPDEPVLVRVHSECMTGDLFHSLRCDCGEQMEAALAIIEQEGRGVFLYMRQEGRGIGLINKIRAYALQDRGMDTVEANRALGFRDDERDYSIAAHMIHSLDVKSVRLMTNNPTKIIGLKGYGLEVVERVPIVVEANTRNIGYLKTKQEKLGHLLGLET